jgi:hypothetical protein
MSQDYCDRHTFVILAYRESKHLEACIQSIVNQSCSSDVCIATATPNGHIQQLAQKYGLSGLRER